MKLLREGELEFVFGDDWAASRLDEQGGVPIPHGMALVDFVAEGDSEIVLVEVKDPAASPSEENRSDYVGRLSGKNLVNENFVPKARDSYTYLHLMCRDAKMMRLVVILGIDGMSIQEPLLMTLGDSLRRRLRQEARQPWKREYMKSCIVVPIERLGDVLPGCTAVRTGG